MALSADLVADVSFKLAQVQEGDRLVKTVHAAISQLESQGHVYTMQLQPTMVGISSQNRDGSGINPVDVHDLLGDIVQAGWLDARVQAIAHEPTGQEDIDWNVRLFQSMHDRCGPLEPTMIKALSLAGSHTNSVLRCFHYEVMHEGDETVCHDGRLSMELLRKHDPDFARAVREGVVWKILSKHVAAQLPQLLGLVQRMGNATLHRGEHELQLMRRLHQTWVQMSSQGSVDFLALKSKVTTGKSVHGKSMPHLYSFVLKTAGGTDPFLLNETETFVRLHSPSTRSLGPGFWEKVSADVKGSNQFPRFRHAMVKLAYCKEAVGSAECKKMLHKDSTASVKEADTIMSTWRKLVTALPDGAELLMKPEVQTCLSYGDMSLAAFTLNVMLPGEDLKKYKTSQSLAHDLVLILEGILKTDLNGPWAAHKVADSGEASGSKQVGAPMAIMRELSSDGSVKDSAVMMAESGFSVGQYVRRKADQETGQVTAIELGRVKLKQPSGSVVRVSIDSFLAGHWQVYTPKPEPQTVDDLSVYSPLNFPEYERQMLLACLYMDMHELMQKHDTNPMLQKLRVTLKPRKSVQATAFIPKNKLIMVPMGLTIKHGQKKPEDAIFDIIAPMSDYFFWIVSFIQIPKAEGDAGFINPAFLVQPLPVSDTWNCEVSHVKSNRDKKVQLPILKNTLDLQQDDVLYMPKAEKTVHVEALQVDTPPRKRICSKKPGEDEEMTAPTVVTKQIVTYGSGLTWIPEQKTAEGVTWFKVSKWDRGLFRFVYGKGLDLRKNTDNQNLSLDTPFFENMLARRQEAFNEAISERLKDEENDEAPQPEKAQKKTKKTKEFKATQKHDIYAPHSIQIDLPGEDDVVKHIQTSFKHSEAKPRKTIKPKRAKDSPQWWAFDRCGLLEVLLPNEDATWSNSAAILGWHKQKKKWRILDMLGWLCQDWEGTWCPAGLVLQEIDATDYEELKKEKEPDRPKEEDGEMEEVTCEEPDKKDSACKKPAEPKEPPPKSKKGKMPWIPPPPPAPATKAWCWPDKSQESGPGGGESGMVSTQSESVARLIDHMLDQAFVTLHVTRLVATASEPVGCLKLISGMATSKALGDQLLTISSLAETMTDQTTKDRMIESCMESAKKQISGLRLTDSAEVQTLFATVQSLNFTESQKDELMRQIGDRFVACSTPKSQGSKKSMQTMDDPGSFLRASDVTFISNPDHTIKAKASRMAVMFCSINCSCPTEPTSGRAVGVLKNDFGLKELEDPQVFYNTVQDFKAALKSHFKSNPSGSTSHVHNFTTPADLPSDVCTRAYGEEGPSGHAGLGGSIGPVRKSSAMLKSQNNQKVPTLDLQVPSQNNMANMMMQGFQSMQHMFNVFAGAQQAGMSGQQNIFMNNTKTNPPKQTLAITNGPDAASSPARAEPEQAQPPMTPEEQVNTMLSSWKNRQEENKKKAEDGKAGDPEGGSEKAEAKGHQDVQSADGSEAAALDQFLQSLGIARIMTSSSSSKPLASLGRKVFVSQRGLESVLSDLKKTGFLADDFATTSRASIKRARDGEEKSWENAFGQMIINMDIPHESDDTKFVKVPFVPPVVLLQHCIANEHYHGLLKKCGQSSPGDKLGIAKYAAEVSPGNQLKPLNARKLQVIYWSIVQHGQDLASEWLWFPLCILRSTLCNRIGGLTVLWKHAIQHMFMDHDMRHGVVLQTSTTAFPVFADLSVLIADEAALKQTAESKGASGTVFCMRCANVVAHRSGLQDHGDVLSSTCTDFTKFRLHTKQSVGEIMRYLSSQHGTVSQKDFQTMEKALGYNYMPGGLLMSNVGHNIPEMIMFDWFHIYLVHGVAGNEVGVLLGRLRDSGFPEQQIHDFVQSFHWPVQFAGADAKSVLAKKREDKTAPVKAEASELLNFLPVLQLFLILFVWRDADDSLKSCCHGFFTLCKILRMLRKATQGGLDPAALRGAIKEHCELYLANYGAEYWVPKNHMTMHLPEFLSRHGLLLSCFVHERKHKLVKRFANNMKNTSRSYEATVLRETLAAQFLAMQDELPQGDVRLIGKRRCTKAMASLIRDVFGNSDGVFQAQAALHGGGFRCSHGDVVRAKHAQEHVVGMIHFHVEVDGLPLTCMSPWSHVADHMYRVKHESFFINTACIFSACIWSRKGDDAIVLLE
ncbi:unnamed protein product [Symbiodinium sp. CCMP2592]|nr:unnamed protein product [Symbiodinium sp. CCMP2592]